MKKFICLSNVIRLIAAVSVVSFMNLLIGNTLNAQNIEEHSDAEEIIWHVKAIHPDGNLIDVKALDNSGNIYDVKAIQNSDQTTFLDIKALINGEKIPIKILVSDDKLMPVKAIMSDGTILNIKAITQNGDKLNVKGVSYSGNIINIKAINKNGNHYGIKAISPKGNLNDVKGVKMFNRQVEMTVSGVDVHAHVKALTQTGFVGDDFIWHIKAIHPEGRTLDVMAFDKNGNSYPVKAIQNTKQRSIIDVKVYVDASRQLSVKILVSDDKFAPVKAIAEDGTIYDIKALTSMGEKLDVKGTSKSGNIIHIKAISKTGEFYGIKAISPSGELNDVKGIKLTSNKIEYKINNIEVWAHIKALPQMK